MRVRIAHISMQASDTPAQQKADAAKVFAHAHQRRYGWITGTEANNAAIADIFRDAAHAAGFYFARAGDVWVAIPAYRLLGTPFVQWNEVVDGVGGDKPGPHFPNRGVLRVTFRNTELGDVTVLASHFQTKRTSKRRPEDNRLLALKVGELAHRYGDGRRKVFYGGDQNITDRTGDTFKGQPLTSCWDELKKWPNTGHDNIDVIASYDADAAVSCVSAQVLDDTEFRLNTDHFLVEAEYVIGSAPAVIHTTTPRSKPKPPIFRPPSPTVVGGHPKNHSGRDNLEGGLKRVVIHSAVIECRPGAARELGHMNQTSEHGSWHYSTDPSETIQCSYDSYVCWHAPPNPRSLAIEMADWPKPWPGGSRTKAWRDKLTKSWRWRTVGHTKMLKRTAELTAELCLAYGLPLVFLSVKDLQADKHGITIHANVSKAFHQSTHWDPGAWPRYRFMRMVRAHAKQLQQS